MKKFTVIYSKPENVAEADTIEGAIDAARRFMHLEQERMRKEEAPLDEIFGVVDNTWVLNNETGSVQRFDRPQDNDTSDYTVF